MEHIIHEELIELMNRIKQNMGDGCQTVLPIHNFFNLSFLNVLWTLIAGVRYHHDDEKLNHLMKLLNSLFKSGSIGGGISSMFPILRKIAPDLVGETEQIKAYTAIQDFIRTSIGEHRKSDLYRSGHDFLDIYLQEIEKSQNDTNSLFTGWI